MITFKEYLEEMAYHLDVGSGLANSMHRKDIYAKTRHLPVHMKINDHVSVHKETTKTGIDYHTLDHKTGECIHQSIIHRSNQPFDCEVQTSADKYEHKSLPKGYATDFVYGHFKTSDMPLRSDNTQSAAGHSMWKRLVDKALNDGHHVYYHDGKQLHKTTHQNKEQHLHSYFGDHYDEYHYHRHMILSKKDLHNA